MMQINWDQFKKFKQEHSNREKLDNFQILLEFIRSADNLLSPEDILEILLEDTLSQQMLQKRGIENSAQIEECLYQLAHS
jgi:hypothetical protein